MMRRAFINRKTERRELIRRYLLGALDVEQQEQLEEQLLEDSLLAEELSQTEDGVIYDYLSGALPEREKEWFENHFLATPENRRKLKFFRAFKDKVESLPANDNVLPRSWKRVLPDFMRGEHFILKLSLAAPVLIVALGAGLLLFQMWPTRPVAVGSTQAVFILSSGPRRGEVGELTRVNIADDTEAVELQLPVKDDDYQSYRAVLSTDKGVPKLVRDGLEAGTGAGGKIVSLSVPPAVLTRGDYRLRLAGRSAGGDVQEVGIYSFRVSKN